MHWQTNPKHECAHSDPLKSIQPSICFLLEFTPKICCSFWYLIWMQHNSIHWSSTIHISLTSWRSFFQKKAMILIKFAWLKKEFQSNLTSQIFIVWSSLAVYIHFPSRWKPNAVTFVLCPSKLVTAELLFVFISKKRIWGFPAVARYCLSGVIWSRLICYERIIFQKLSKKR